MTRNEILKAMKTLTSAPVASIIIKNLQGYYYYFNWTAGQENRLHFAECGHCAFGSGKHESENGGDKGVWIGPFKTRQIAIQRLKKYFNINGVIDCKHCERF